MARQTGPIKFIGTYNGVLYYRMQGDYFVRKASSLTARRFYKDKAFENSRKSSYNFGLASSIARQLYQMMDERKRKVAQYRMLVKAAITLFKQGAEQDMVRAVLMECAGLKPKAKKEKQDNPSVKTEFPLNEKKTYPQSHIACSYCLLSG